MEIDLLGGPAQRGGAQQQVEGPVHLAAVEQPAQRTLGAVMKPSMGIED
jgi:hypothetical protein